MMICWQKILVTGTALCVSTSMLMAQPASTTYERLRKAALESQQGSEKISADHPLAPGNRLATKPVETESEEKAPEKETRPFPATTVSEKTKSEPETSVEKPQKSLIIQASHKLDAKPAVHEVEQKDEPANPAGGRVIHAAYSNKKGAAKEDQIIQVKASQTIEELDLASQKPLTTPQVAAKNPNVSVEWKPQGEIMVGEECAFDLVVKNNGDVSVEDIEIDAFFPQTVRLTAARPKPSSAYDRVTWKLSSLDPGAQQKLSVKLIPSRRGEIQLSSKVRFTGETAGKFVVAEPVIGVSVEGPEQVLIGEPVAHVIKIANTGTGTARDVSLEALIPEGLKHPRGERLLLEVGSLEAGEVREVRLALAAVEGGDQTIKLATESSNALRNTQSVNLMVAAPSLALKFDGPGLRYKGREGVYTLVVENDGTAVSENVRVRHRLPNGFEFVKADNKGKYDAETRVIDWFFGAMKPGGKHEINVHLAAVNFGEFTHEVAAISDQGAQAIAELDTRVEGTAALSLEIVDLDDPVEVGADNAYEIRVKNGGSIAAGNVGVAFELPEGVDFVSAKGPSDHVFEKGIVFFRSVQSLKPNQEVAYQIQVKGSTAGNHRFRARLASDSIQEPLIFEELTKYYGE
ncbi:MAG: DUF11 domain-containing protein [Planctomycetaceae bacterium]|nr:DUF11 domain-containing protein [Planctomycetaceae bacterium]